jgi:hypothetical protein
MVSKWCKGVSFLSLRQAPTPPTPQLQPQHRVYQHTHGLPRAQPFPSSGSISPSHHPHPPPSPSMDSASKRRRVSPAPVDDPYAISDSEEAYVPAKQRKQALLNKLSSKHHGGYMDPAERKKDEQAREEEEEERLNGKKQKGTAQTLLMEAQEVKRLKAIAGGCIF